MTSYPQQQETYLAPPHPAQPYTPHTPSYDAPRRSSDFSQHSQLAPYTPPYTSTQPPPQQQQQLQPYPNQQQLQPHAQYQQQQPPYDRRPSHQSQRSHRSSHSHHSAAVDDRREEKRPSFGDTLVLIWGTVKGAVSGKRG